MPPSRASKRNLSAPSSCLPSDVSKRFDSRRKGQTQVAPSQYRVNPKQTGAQDVHSAAVISITGKTAFSNSAFEGGVRLSGMTDRKESPPTPGQCQASVSSLETLKKSSILSNKAVEKEKQKTHRTAGVHPIQLLNNSTRTGGNWWHANSLSLIMQNGYP